MFKGLINKYKLVRHALKYPGKGNSSTYMKYPPNCNFDGKRVLNLGCGTTTYKFPNVVNLDMFEGKGIDFIWDLSKTPLPFKNNVFDFIIANHVLEHIPNWWECFKELARIIKVGGIIEIWVPGDGTTYQQGYRDHINIINHCSFTGVRGTFRNDANSWEIEERKKNKEVSDIAYIDKVGYKPLNLWWVHIMPVKLQLWIMEHLRNIIQEQCYKFIKLPGEKDGKTII